MFFRQVMAWGVLIGVLAVSLVAYQYRQETLFPITTVKIKGDFRYVSRDELTETIAPFLNLGFFGLLPTKIQALLLNKPILLEGGTGVYNKTTTIARMCRDLNMIICKWAFFASALTRI